MNLNLKNKIKSEKGFGMGDVALALIIISISVGFIGSSIYTIYSIQIVSKMSSVETLYGIQILERIDRISYTEIEKLENVEDKNLFCIQCRKDFKIPSGIKIDLNVETPNPDKSNNTIKKISLKLISRIAKRDEVITFEKLKIKEL